MENKQINSLKRGLKEGYYQIDSDGTRRFDLEKFIQTEGGREHVLRILGVKKNGE